MQELLQWKKSAGIQQIKRKIWYNSRLQNVLICINLLSRKPSVKSQQLPMNACSQPKMYFLVPLLIWHLTSWYICNDNLCRCLKFLHALCLNTNNTPTQQLLLLSDRVDQVTKSLKKTSVTRKLTKYVHKKVSYIKPGFFLLASCRRPSWFQSFAMNSRVLRSVGISKLGWQVVFTSHHDRSPIYLRDLLRRFATTSDQMENKAFYWQLRSEVRKLPRPGEGILTFNFTP